jgi:hypothetical protein
MDPLPPPVSPGPVSPDPGYLRTRAAYHHLIHTLGKSLPPPNPDTPEDRHRRDQAAITQIAALCPANAAEATLAAQFVAASEQAMDCLRLTHDPVTPALLTLKCNAQAALMMRQAQGAMRTLLQVQAARRKTNADEAAWTEYTTGQVMIDFLTELQSTAVEEAPPPPTPPSELLQPSAARPVQPGPVQPGPVQPGPIQPGQTRPDQTSPDEVETYIHLYPRRAAEIRRARGMPRNATFPPPDDAIVRVLAAGTAPALRLLDRTVT